MSFSETWLQSREEADNKARNKAIEHFAVSYFKDKEITILDLGTGSGNNFFYYNAIFPSAHWVLLDEDQDLLNICAKRISQNKLNHVRLSRKSIHYLNSRNLVDVTLITANALFDLFSREQFIEFSKLIASLNICILSTLNYKDMMFLPEMPLDNHYITMYNEHMSRKQSFGYAMGASCGVKVVNILEKRGYDVKMGVSCWELDGDRHSVLINGILSYMESSICEMISEREKKEFVKWLEEKKSLLEKKLLSLSVEHIDFFSCPGKA